MSVDVESIARLEQDEDWRKVRMTPTLMQVIAEATVGRDVRVTWSGPDAEGFWTPTVTVRTPAPRSAHRLTSRGRRRVDGPSGAPDKGRPT